MFKRSRVLINFLRQIAPIIYGLLLSLVWVSPLHATPPIKIGLTLGLTGKYAEMSQMQKRGYELWASEVNKRGGLLGRKVMLLIRDDRSDPELARTLYENFIKEGVDLIFSPYSSEITEAVAPVAERHGYPMIVAGASADRIWQRGYRYIFGLSTPSSRYTVGFLELLVMNNIEGLAIIYADDSFSTGVAEGTKTWAERLDLKISFFKGFRKTDPNLEKLLKEAKDSGARVLILCGHLDESIKVKHLLKGLNWNPIYYATVGPATDRFYTILGADAELTFSSSHWEYNPSSLEEREFFQSFQKTYGLNPNYHAATAYAAGQLIEQTIIRAKTTEKEQLREILSRAEALTILGRYKVNRSGLQTRHQYLVIQWQKGKREVLWPDYRRTAIPKWN